MCYPVENIIGHIHFVVVSLRVSLCNFVTYLYKPFMHCRNTKTWLLKCGNKKISYVLLPLLPCVVIQKYLRGLGLSLGVLASFNITVL